MNFELYLNVHHTNMLFSSFITGLYNKLIFVPKVFNNVHNSFINSLGLYKSVKYNKLLINYHGPQISAPRSYLV